MYNYFHELGLEISFDLNLKHLASQYRDMQNQNHPDRFLNTTDKIEAQKKSALINIAFETLQDPIKRAEHILTLHNISLENTEVMSQEDLLQYMSLYENVEAYTTKSEIISFIDRIHSMIYDRTERLRVYFSVQDFKSAHINVAHIKYLNRLIEYTKRSNTHASI